MQNLVWKKTMGLNQFFPEKKEKSLLKSKDWDGTSGSNTQFPCRNAIHVGRDWPSILCIYVSCRYEIHEGRADTSSVRRRLRVYTLSIRVLNKNKLTSLYPEIFLFPSFP